MKFRNSVCDKIYLRPAEFLMLTIGLTAGVIDLALILYKSAKIDFPAYLGLVSVILFILPLGFYYRISGRSERIASALICTAAFLFFSMCLSLFNYLLLPLSRPLIDLQLAQIDLDLFGYYWPDVMALAAEYPVTSYILKVAYMTTVPQFALLIVILGLTNRMKDLHEMITSVAITATLSICFWGVYPSMGVTVIHTIGQVEWSTLAPIVDLEYANDMRKIAIEGPGLITPKEIRGLIAFPSYHAVLAFTAMYAARNVPIIASIFFVLNLLILPAIFVHGGHHFVDLFGGFAMFLLGTVVANRAVKRDLQDRAHLPASRGGPAINMPG